MLCSTFAGRLLAAENRILRPVDVTRLTTLRRQTPAQALPQFDLGPEPATTALRYATLRLKPAEGLEAFLAEQRTPASPNYHRWLTPEQFGARFGVSTEDIAKLVAWLQSQGLQVEDVARGRDWIAFSGTVEAANRAFHTVIHRYRINRQLHFANSTDPMIPEAFEDVVSGVDGLDDFGLEPLFQLELPAGSGAPQFNTGGTHYLTPDDFATIYNLTPLYNTGITGAGQRIAVIGRSDIDVADVRQFRQMFNLPPQDPQLVLFGPDPGSNGSRLEANLDLEWGGAVARDATLLYVYSSSVTVAAQYAVDQNLAPVITFSYGGCEAYNSAGLRAVAQQANAQGITWLAAAGDWGAATCDVSSPTPQVSKGPSASFPASIPEITAVGGTEFDDGSGENFWAAVNDGNGSSALSYIPERAWNTAAARDDLSAGGGGPSILFRKPPWQTGPGVPNDNARDTPDIALASSPEHYAYILYSDGGPLHVAGTSVASPTFAGMVALLNQYLAANGAPAGLGNINPVLYRLAQSTTDIFHDITAGDNRLPCVQGSPACGAAGMGYAAGPGYDLTTGLGSVDAYRLVTEWNSGTATATVLTAAPAAVSLSDTVTLTASVTAKRGIPTGTITFSTGDAMVGVAPLTSSGTATLAVPATQLAPGNGTLTAIYGGDAVFDGSAGNTTIKFKVPATGAFLVPFVTPNPVTQAGPYWPYTVGIAEKAGVGATITSFLIDGIRQNLSFWTSTTIPPNGSVSANLTAFGLTPPVSREFVFSGTDANGQAWTQQITVPFVSSPGPGLAPSVVLSSEPAVVRQNPQGDPSCQWAQQLTVQETGGFLVDLMALHAGGNDFSGQIQRLFGTTRLAPYGMLRANLCWDAGTAPGTKKFQLTGISELGTAVSASLSASLVQAAPNPVRFSATPAQIDIPAGGSTQTSSVSIHLKFEGGAPQWTAKVLPANRTSSWLKLSGGFPDGQVTLLASSAGLANGVYRAMVSLEAPDATPAAIAIPVTMVVGAAGNMTISGIANTASGKSGVAPGATVALSGSGLAASTAQAGRLPLPFTLAGVSATVNGVSAPVYAVSPGEVDIQIPYETGSGRAVLAVNNGGQIASFAFPVTVAAPAIYNFFIDNNTGAQNSGRPGDVMTMFVDGAGDLTPTVATGATPSQFTSPVGIPRPRLPLALTIGGKMATVVFAGNASGLVGTVQINFVVPADIAPGPQPLVLAVGEAVTDPVSLTIVPPQGP